MWIYRKLDREIHIKCYEVKAGMILHGRGKNVVLHSGTYEVRKIWPRAISECHQLHEIEVGRHERHHPIFFRETDCNNCRHNVIDWEEHAL